MFTLNIIFWIAYSISIIIAIEIFSYLWHRYGAHSNYLPGINSTHRLHHSINSEELNGDEDFFWILLLITLFELFLGFLVIAKIIPGILAIVTIIISLVVFSWNWWLHRSFHQNNHWLNSYSWFQKEKSRHQIHHHHPNKNYGIATYFTDKIFNTWLDLDQDLNKDSDQNLYKDLNKDSDQNLYKDSNSNTSLDLNLIL